MTRAASHGMGRAAWLRRGHRWQLARGTAVRDTLREEGHRRRRRGDQSSHLRRSRARAELPVRSCESQRDSDSQCCQRVRLSPETGAGAVTRRQVRENEGVARSSLAASHRTAARVRTRTSSIPSSRSFTCQPQAHRASSCSADRPSQAQTAIRADADEASYFQLGGSCDILR